MNKKLFIYTIFTVAVVTIFLSRVKTGAATEAVALDTLELSEAVARAIERSSELKTLDESAYLNELNRVTLETAKVESVHETQYINSLVSLFQNELRQAILTENIAMQKLIIEYSVTRYYGAAAAAERDLILYDVGLGLSEKNFKIAEVRHKLGMISKNTFETIKSNYEKESANREMKLIAIENAFRALNGAIGSGPGARWALLAEIEYEPLEEYNLAHYIPDCVKTNVAVINKENDLELAKYRRDVSNDPDAEEELDIGVTQAERALSDTKKTLGDKLTSCYEDIRSMETQYELGVKDYEDMLGQLKLKETQYGLGKLTLLDVENYKYQMLQLEYRLKGRAYDHHVRKMQFMNPDLL